MHIWEHLPKGQYLSFLQMGLVEFKLLPPVPQAKGRLLEVRAAQDWHQRWTQTAVFSLPVVSLWNSSFPRIMSTRRWSYHFSKIFLSQSPYFCIENSRKDWNCPFVFPVEDLLMGKFSVVKWICLNTAYFADLWIAGNQLRLLEIIRLWTFSCTGRAMAPCFLINSLKVANAHADIPVLCSNTGWSLPPAQGAL